MFWLVSICLLAIILVPIAVAVMESMWIRKGSRDVGFWGWARIVGGTCHVPWGRRASSPIVLFKLRDGEARGRATKAAGWRRWRVELRAYHTKPYGFAARLCCPPQPHLRWRTPGLIPIELFNDEVGFLPEFSFETTQDNLLRWLLRHTPTRHALEHLRTNCGAERIEIILGNQQILMRADTPKNWKVGAAVQHMGPAMLDALKKLSVNLADLAEAMKGSGEFENDATICPGCAQDVDGDPHRCNGCGHFMHRGCVEMVGGCPILDCTLSADALPGLKGIDVAADDGEDETPMVVAHG